MQIIKKTPSTYPHLIALGVFLYVDEFISYVKTSAPLNAQHSLIIQSFHFSLHA